MERSGADSARPIVSVVIGSLNRRWYLKRTIASVRTELPFSEREIIVIDGGSDDGSVRWLTEQKDLITILQHNRGEWDGEPVPRRSWGYFMNLGFKAASAPYVCMLSDDCLVVPGAIRSGLELFESDGADVGAVAFYWRNWPEQRQYWVGLTFGGRMFVNHGLFRSEALASVGYADETAFRFYHGDGDLALRMSEAGWRCVDSPGSYIEHFSHANRAVRAANLAHQDLDWSTYESRWGHLGPAEPDWIERPFSDSGETARRYWGRRAVLRARVSALPTLLRRFGRGRTG